MRVLLAADQPINAESAATILEETEASVSHAEDGLVARKLFVDPKPGFFDVVLMDLRMPHMNGFGVTAPIREMNRADAKTVPIIALTADAFAEDAQRCEAAGMDSHPVAVLITEEHITFGPAAFLFDEINAGRRIVFLIAADEIESF